MQKEVKSTERRISTFELMILILGLAVAILGFVLINKQYSNEGERSWLLIMTIFLWLILLILFIQLSIQVDLSRKQLEEIRVMNELLRVENKKKPK